MKLLKNILFIAIGLFISIQLSIAQVPATNNNQAGYRKEFYGGLELHSNGWGATFTYAKFQTYKNKTLFYAGLVRMKHSKEIKTAGFLDEAAKDFVFGKLNGLGTLRLAYGKKKMIFEKKREKGVEVSSKFLIGPSLGLLRPIYLDVNKVTPINTVVVVSEKYDPEDHNLGNIYGQTRGFKGFSEIKLKPGLFLQGGFNFEYNDDRSVIKAIEVGASVDVFLERIEILTLADNPFIFPTVYIHLLMGKRFF